MSGFSDHLSGYLSKGKDESHLNFNQGFGTNLVPFMDAAKEAGHNISIYSGYRSDEHQGRLYQDALEKYGSPAAARKWVAPPGKSQHNHGTAADLKYGSDEARSWAHQNAPSFGLHFRMDWEPWHIELDPNAEAVSDFVNRDDGIGKQMLSAVFGEPKPDGEQPSQPEEGESKNTEVSLAAAEEAAGSDEKQVQEVYEPEYSPLVQQSVTDAVQDTKMYNVAEAAINFFNSLNPQQRMMEQQAYMISRRQDADKRSIEEWFSTERFPSYVTGFQKQDPQTTENLTPQQRQALEKTTQSLTSLDMNKVLGLA
jgi:LAS superfamily LD-carboxypeptidase LdcB